jgi:hypothetical protein
MKERKGVIVECKKCKSFESHHAKGLCLKCYSKKRKEPKICLICKQKKNHFAKDMCCKCYKNENQRFITCPICKRYMQHHARGFCSMCYRRVRAQEEPDYKAKLKSHYYLQFKKCKECKKKRYIEKTDLQLCSYCWRKKKKAESTWVCPSCERVTIHHAKGVCQTCYHSVKRPENRKKIYKFVDEYNNWRKNEKQKN